MIRFVEWLFAIGDDVRSSMPIYLALVLSVIAISGQAAAYPHADTTPEFGAGLTQVLAINALIGIVLSLLFNPMVAFSGSVTDDDIEGYPRVFATLGISAGLQIIGGFCFSIEAGVNGDWTPLWLPLAVGAGIGFAVAALGWIAGTLVMWPLITLVHMLWKKLTGRAVNAFVTAGAVFFLTLVGTGVATSLGTDAHARSQMGPRRGVTLILRTWIDQTGDPTELAFRWAARCLMVILVLVFVWVLVVGQRERRAAKR